MAVSHVFTNPVADGTITSIVRPSDWNSAHQLASTFDGNTLGASSWSGTNLVLAATNNVSLSLAGNTLSISGPDLTQFLTTAALSNHGHGASAANGSFSFQTLSFSNANGVSFGTSAGSAITASHNALTSQSNQAFSAAGGSSAFQTLSFSDNAFASWTNNAGQVAVTELRGSFFATSNTTQSSSGTINLDSVIVNGAGIVSAGVSNGSIVVSATQSNQAFSAAGGSSAFQTLGFSDNAYASWTNTNGSVALTELRASLFAVSNTTQSSSGTQNIDAISFAGAGIASVGVTNGSVVISVPAGGGGGDGGVFAGVSNLGNTAGSTGTVSTGNFVLVASNGITLSQSTGAAGSAATVTIDGGWPTYSRNEFKAVFEPAGFGSASLAQNTLYIWPVRVEGGYFTGDAVVLPFAVTNSSSAGNSGQKGQTIRFGVYTRHSTNSTVLTQHYSTSYTIAASYSSNVSMMISVITGIGNSTSYNTLTASSAGLNLSQSLHGAREIIMPFSTMLTPGEYWLALLNSTSAAGTTGAVLTMQNWIHSGASANRIGVSVGSSRDGWMRTVMQGVYSTSTGALPGGISQTQVNMSAFAPVVRFGVQTA